MLHAVEPCERFRQATHFGTVLRSFRNERGRSPEGVRAICGRPQLDGSDPQAHATSLRALAGQVHHKALMEAVLQYLKSVMIPDVLREMGHTGSVPDARLQIMAEQMRDQLLVDSLE